MAIHRIIRNPGMYFITFTCYNWLHLIEITNTYEEVYNFLDILNSSGHRLSGYVIMPNHVHLLLYFKMQNQSLNTIIGNGKRFIGYEIIDRLKAAKQHAILKLLSEAVSPAERIRNKQHEIWQGTFEVKECRTEAFILQKLNYIHSNPCAERWRLCKKPYEFEHSSASFYQMGKHGKVDVTDYQDLLPLLID